MENLKSSASVIAKRVELINSFNCKKYPVLVNTKIIKHNEFYEYRQEYFNRINPSNALKKDLYQVASGLDYFQKIGYIHGDINKKNVIYTKNGFKIVDYEPDLVQIKNGKKQYMITNPYISNLDLQENQITIRTDKIGFFYFILRINGFLTSEKVVLLSKNFNHYKYLGIKEKELDFTSYKQLIDKAFKIMKK